ncbi:hypothetical protein HYU13_00560 [Candidatus Woesearchaeota archaeon]|nr:hypothetical protein [Candidatus Woesearchaeota archaeon]
MRLASEEGKIRLHWQVCTVTGSFFFLLLLFPANGLDSPVGLVRANGTIFIFNNGTAMEPFWFSGTNAYFLWFGSFSCNKTNPHPKGYCVPELLDDAKAMNFTVIRTWAFGEADNWGANNTYSYSFQPEPGVYDERTFSHFDKVIEEAGKRGLKLLLTLANNWNDYGGIFTTIAARRAFTGGMSLIF